MKLSLLKALRCPKCGSSLQLHDIVSRKTALSPSAARRAEAEAIDPALLTTVVETGVLACAASCAWYPIINHVPVLLDFAVPLHERFRDRYGKAGGKPFDLPLPAGRPRRGELHSQKSFTIEWNTLGENSFTFVFTIPGRERHLRAELDWPRQLLERQPTAPALRVLDVGAGFGLEPIYIHNATGGPAAGAETIGIDVNLSLLDSGAKIAAMPFVHTVIASLFAPPFAERSFDLVYANGVLHHTYSTKAALCSIERFRKPEGAIYVWVYAIEDVFQMTWKGRLQYALETRLRPSFARLPPTLQNLALYPLAWRNLRTARRSFKRGAEWTLRNALHDARDRWTPLFAHRHRFNEVLMWFSELGLSARPIDPLAVQAQLPIPIVGIGVRGVARNSGFDHRGVPQ